MSHNIEQYEDGSAAFFSARVPAWHKLGTVTDDALNAQDALKIAQLDWLVEKHPVFAQIDLEDRSLSVPVPDRFATCRFYPKVGYWQALATVGAGYHVIQNHEAFEVLNDIVDESGAHFDTAGAIDNGRKVFMTMRLPETMSFANGQDAVELYLIATNSHDATRAFTLAVTPVRVVCQNTLTLALSSARRTFSIWHTENARRRIEEAREALSLTFKYVDDFEAEVEKLLNKTYTDTMFEQLVEQLLPIADDASNVTERHKNEQRDVMKSLWTAPTQANVANTGWAAYNAIVEYADWFSPARANDVDEARALRIMKGKSDLLKNRAHELILS